MKKFYSDYLKANLPFWVCLITSIALLVVSFFLPPTGVINATVLEGVAELFAFAGLGAVYEAIRKGTPASIEHNGTTISVNKEGDAEAGSEGID